MAASNAFIRLASARLVAHGAVDVYRTMLEQEMVAVLETFVGFQVVSWKYDGAYEIVAVGCGEEACVDVEPLLFSSDPATFTAAHFVLEAAFALTKLAPALMVLRAETPAV